MNFRLPALILVLLTGLAAPAAAQALSDDYRALLEDAATLDGGAHFESAVRLVSRSAPGGAAAVAEALETIAPDRAGEARALLGVSASAPAAPVAQTAEAPAPMAEAEETGFLGGFASALTSPPEEDARWSGKLRAGLRWDDGNTEQQDYTLGVELDRALDVWGFHAAFDYAYSEADGAVSRDQLNAEIRGEREAGERWTVFAEGDFERDVLSSYEYTAFAGLGVGYRLIERPGMLWTLRAAPGVRYRKPEAGSSSTGIAAELGSEFTWDINERVDFTSDTSLTVADASRAEQVFALGAEIGGGWGTEASYRYRYDFDPRPGFEKGDSRLDVAIVKEF